MSFSNKIQKWCKKAEVDITKVRQRAVVKLGEEMARTIPQGGRVPFLTGNLARSLLASTSESLSAGSSNVGIVAASLRAGQPVWLGYQATYARRQNYGFVGADSMGRVYNQQGYYFVEGAIADWDNMVKEAINEVKHGA